MTLAWPQMLWLLLLLPVLAAVLLLLERRRRKSALRVAAQFAVADTARRGGGLRRGVPRALFLVGVALSILAMARPSTSLILPAQRATVILSLDMSGSMRATDIKPTRMEAVQAAARTFVHVQPRGVRVGVVAFSGSAFLVQAPTTDRSQVLAAIDQLRPQMFTAVGSGLLAALQALFPERARALEDAADAPLVHGAPEQAPPVAPGSDTNAAIVLLSDGQSNQGPDPLDVAQQAAEAGVRVYTVGVGTAKGADLSFGSFRFHAILDEASLRNIARITGGQYFKASSAEQLRDIYSSLGTRIELERGENEITALVVAAALCAFVGMAALSMAWFRRLL